MAIFIEPLEIVDEEGAPMRMPCERQWRGVMLSRVKGQA